MTINERLAVPRDNDSKSTGNTRDGKVAVKHIGVVLFDGFELPDAVSVVEAFQFANALVERDRRLAVPYKVRLLSTIGGCIASSSSVHVWTDSVDTSRHVKNFHALFIAGGGVVEHTVRDDRVLAWMRRTCERAGFVYPIGEARVLLEAAGFTCSQAGGHIGPPGSHLTSPPLGLLTTQNEPAALRAALSIIQEDCSAEIVRQITSHVISPAPTHFSDIIRRNAMRYVSERIQASARWLEENGDRPVAIGEAAQVAAMSGRNFLRRFKAEMGVTPYKYLLHSRLDRCCRLLVETRLPADKIARRCGFGSGGRLSKLFRRHFGKTPTDYRASLRR